MIFLLFFICLNISSISTRAIQITNENIQSIISSNEFVLINFYANWCRFSQILNPIYDQLAEKVNQEYTKKNVILIGKVDSDKEELLTKKYQINKYPTLKYFRHGILVKREYRGSRNFDSLLNFIHEQLQSPIRNINEIDRKSSFIIGYFHNQQSENYQIFSKIANLLRDHCHFVHSINNELENESIYYHPSEFSNQFNESYKGKLNDENQFYTWSHNKCTELVREITFENAEELTDEGLPFLILFHHPNDSQSILLFKQQVQKQLQHQLGTINCLHADGTKFTHPLKHLNKQISDLPLLVIDTFKHMILFPDFNLISINGKLLEFVKDLHSGKLHRDFHQTSINIQENLDTGDVINRKNFNPLESIFIHLSPSRKRYSFRDEL